MCDTYDGDVTKAYSHAATKHAQVLQQEVVKVVNTIADHTHRAVIDNYGAPNKNIGDAFLVGVLAVRECQKLVHSYTCMHVCWYHLLE